MYFIMMMMFNSVRFSWNRQGWLKVTLNVETPTLKYEKIESLVCIYEISRELVFKYGISEWMFWLIANNKTRGPSLWWEAIQPWERVQESGLESAMGAKVHDAAWRTHANCLGPSTYKQTASSTPITHQLHPSSWSEAKRDRQGPSSSTLKMLVVWSLVLQLSCLTLAIPSIQGVSQVKKLKQNK